MPSHLATGDINSYRGKTRTPNYVPQRRAEYRATHSVAVQQMADPYIFWVIASLVLAILYVAFIFYMFSFHVNGDIPWSNVVGIYAIKRSIIFHLLGFWA